jgi:alpha-1,2-mannosyltransferase
VLSRPVAFFAALFFPLFLLFTATASYDGHQVNDAIAAAVPAWQVANEGTLTIPADAPKNHWWVETPEGRRVSNRFPGVIGFAVPFYLLTRGSAPRPTVPEASLAAAFAAALAVALLAVALRPLVGDRLAAVAALLLGLGTNTWSVSASVLLTHGPAQLWLAVGLLAASRGVWPATAPAYALAVLTRPHLVLVPVVAAAWHAVRDRLWRAALWLAAGAAAGLGLLVAYNHHVYGAWSLQGGYEDSVGDALGSRGLVGLAVNLLGTLFSPARGLLGFSPFVLFLLVGVRPAWRAAPSWARSAALGGAAYLLLQLQANRFSGGTGFYGYRLPLEALTLATPLLVLAYREWVAPVRWRRLVLAVLVAYSVAVQVLGAVWFADDGPAEASPWTQLAQLDGVRRAGVLGCAVAALCGAAFVWLARRSLRGAGEQPA